MAAFSVTYDLRKSGKNYDGLTDELKKTLAYIKYQRSAWLVKTNETATQLNDRLLKQIDNDDLLLVIEVKPNYAGWLPKDDWDFIREHIFS